ALSGFPRAHRRHTGRLRVASLRPEQGLATDGGGATAVTAFSAAATAYSAGEEVEDGCGHLLSGQLGEGVEHSVHETVDGVEHVVEEALGVFLVLPDGLGQL